MVEFFRRNQVLLTSGCLLVLALLLISTSVSKRQMREPVSALVLEGTRPLQGVVTQAVRGLGHLWRRYVALIGLRRENDALRQRILELEQNAVRLAEIEQTNRRLSSLLDFRPRSSGVVHAAQITGKDPLPWFRSFVVDKGTSDGIRKGLPVLSPHGLVGQVYATTSHASRVLLITDHNSGVDALVQRSRARGIVGGAVRDGCVMKYLKPGEDVREGDTIVTSGFDGIFPKGVVVGRVTRLSEPARGLLQEAEVRPAVPFEELEEVLIVDLSAPPAEEVSAQAPSAEEPS